jgi:hypothetical protein
MSGPKQSNINAQQGYATSQGGVGADQVALGNRLADQSQKMLDTQQAYQAPYAKFLQGIIGGDTNSKIATAAVPIAQIAQGSQQAKENILDTQPAGAARDFALAGLKRDQSAQTSGFLNTAYLNAFPTLASLGTTNAQIGLQQLGGGLTGLSGGSSSFGGAGTQLGNLNQMQANQKSGILGGLGGLASTIGGAALGMPGIFGGGGTGGGGYTPNVGAPLGSTPYNPNAWAVT